MNSNVINRLHKIQIENKIWVVYLCIIGLSYLANHYEKDYFLHKIISSKNTYRMINAFIFLVLIFIYLYFELDSLDSLLSSHSNRQKQNMDFLSFIASSAVLLSGILFFYIILVDNDLEEEIAFN